MSDLNSASGGSHTSDAEDQADAQDIQSASAPKLRRVDKRTARALKHLQQAFLKDGMNYVLMLHHKDGMVRVHATSDLHPYVSMIDPTQTLRAAMCLSSMERQLTKLKSSNSSFEQLSGELQHRVLMHLIDTAIPQRKLVMPFTSQPTDAALQRWAAWWPPEVPYKHPKDMLASERMQLAQAISKAAEDDDASLDELFADAVNSVYRMKLRPQDEEVVRSVLNRLFEGAVGRLHLHPYGSLAHCCSRWQSIVHCVRKL